MEIIDVICEYHLSFYEESELFFYRLCRLRRKCEEPLGNFCCSLIPLRATVVEVTYTLFSVRVLPWLGLHGIVEMVCVQKAAVTLSLSATAFILW